MLGGYCLYYFYFEVYGEFCEAYYMAIFTNDLGEAEK